MTYTDAQVEWLAETLWHMFAPGARTPPITAWQDISPRLQDASRARARIVLEGLPE
jgi:hypothetical protein